MNKFTYSEQIKFERILNTFSLNFRLTELYAFYLERFPEIITEEMINALCQDEVITKKDALSALICEIFNLDQDKSEEDKRLIRDYIIPSVTLLDAKKYTTDPYYKNIKLPDIKDGNWEFKNESYKPYRAVIAHDMKFFDDFKEFPPLGFFTEEFKFPAVLEDGNEWMTLTPVDMDTCEEAIEKARGKVVTFGLGLGYYAYMASLKENVSSVTVVEKSEKVIELFKKYIFPHFPSKDKIKIVNADAFEYAEEVMPEEEFDFAFVDIWRDASDGAPIYKRMKPLEKLSKKTEFSYWIENFLISRLRAEKFVEIKELYRAGKLDMSYDEAVLAIKNPIS